MSLKGVGFTAGSGENPESRLSDLESHIANA